MITKKSGNGCRLCFEDYHHSISLLHKQSRTQWRKETWMPPTLQTENWCRGKRQAVNTTLASCVSLEAISDLPSCKAASRQPLNDMSKDPCQQRELSPDPPHPSSENMQQRLPLHGKTEMIIWLPRSRVSHACTGNCYWSNRHPSLNCAFVKRINQRW